MSHNMKFMLNGDKEAASLFSCTKLWGKKEDSSEEGFPECHIMGALENISPKIYYLLSCNFLLLVFARESSCSTSPAWNDFVMWKIECYELWYAISFCNFVLYVFNILITNTMISREVCVCEVLWGSIQKGSSFIIMVISVSMKS